MRTTNKARSSTPQAAKEAGNMIRLAGTIGGLGDIAEASSRSELASTAIFTMSSPSGWLLKATVVLHRKFSRQHAVRRPAPRPWAPSPRYKRLLLLRVPVPTRSMTPLSGPAGPHLRRCRSWRADRRSYGVTFPVFLHGLACTLRVAERERIVKALQGATPMTSLRPVVGRARRRAGAGVSATPSWPCPGRSPIPILRPSGSRGRSRPWTPTEWRSPQGP